MFIPDQPPYALIGQFSGACAQNDDTDLTELLSGGTTLLLGANTLTRIMEIGVESRSAVPSGESITAYLTLVGTPLTTSMPSVILDENHQFKSSVAAPIPPNAPTPFSGSLVDIYGGSAGVTLGVASLMSALTGTITISVRVWGYRYVTTQQ